MSTVKFDILAKFIARVFIKTKTAETFRGEYSKTDSECGFNIAKLQLNVEMTTRKLMMNMKWNIAKLELNAEMTHYNNKTGQLVVNM